MADPPSDTLRFDSRGHTALLVIKLGAAGLVYFLKADFRP